MPKLPADLQHEVGSSGVSVLGPGYGSVGTWEETAELQWPNSVIVFDRMRKTDAQTGSVLRAATLPIRRGNWHLVGTDCRPEVIALLETELGLFPKGEGRRRRRRQGVAWDEFLRHALLMLPLGFMPFEQTYEIGPPPAGLDDKGLPSQIAHIHKLAPRMPRTISDFDIAPDGGLRGLKQWVRRENSYYDEVTMKTDRLVMFVNDQEGADWAGNSILRASYKHWLLKDALIRLGPISAERSSMGYPTVTYPDQGDRALALAVARGVRAGEDSGAALPAGYTLELVGVSGQLKDELPLIRYHDESIGRNALQMFTNLGHDRGARSLGETFLDFFLLAEEAVTDHICEVVTEHVIRDFVELNFGEDEPYPELAIDQLTADDPLTAEALKQLVESGVVLPDEELEMEIRRRYGLPQLPGTPTGPPSEDIEDIDEIPVGEPGAPAPPVGPPAPSPGSPPEQPEPFEPEEPEGPTPQQIQDAADEDGISPDDLFKLVNAAAVLIRSGFDPASALQAVGLDPIKHLGLLPITVKQAPASADLSRRGAPRRRPGMPAEGGITYEQENQVILRNRAKPGARKPHKFRPAQWTTTATPRCLVCGGEQPPTGQCDGAAAATGLSLTELEWRMQEVGKKLAALRARG